jgi:AraC family transcriptional regulator
VIPRPAELSQVQPVIAFAARNLALSLSLRTLAQKAGLSTFHLHRLFSAAAGETPKQFTLRLRLSLAAVLLLRSRQSILNVALSCGFESHESFCRAFRRRFGITPRAYRQRGFATPVTSVQASAHAALIGRISPCVGLYRIEKHSPERSHMNYSIAKKELTPQPVLIVRRKVKRSEIAGTIAECLPLVFQYAQQKGIALAGPPLTRYVQSGPGLLTIEAGMPVASSAELDPITARGVIAETLPGGPAAVTMHPGPYDSLSDAYAALEEWIDRQGLAPAGAPWEVYVTDPADYPNPADWKTEIFWPVEP